MCSYASVNSGSTGAAITPAGTSHGSLGTEEECDFRWGPDPHDISQPGSTGRIKGIGVVTSSLGVPQSPEGGRGQGQSSVQQEGPWKSEHGVGPVMLLNHVCQSGDFSLLREGVIRFSPPPQQETLHPT